MGHAAPQAASGNTRSEHDLAFASEALRALRLAWGDVYMFGQDEQGWWAATPVPGWFRRAGTPEELGSLCAAQFEANPS